MKKQLLLTILISLFNAYGLKSMSKPASRTYNETASEKLVELIENHKRWEPVDLKAVKEFLEAGADPNNYIPEETDAPLMHIAIDRRIMDPQFYDLMSSYGADLSLKDINGLTLFDLLLEVLLQLEQYKEQALKYRNEAPVKREIEKFQQLVHHINKLMTPPAPPALWPAMPQGDQKTASADNAAAAAENKPDETAGATKP